MSLEHLTLAKTNDLPIRHQGNVHSGKVRSVYWLTAEDSQRLIQEHHYPVHPSVDLGVMVTSDGLSAFDCNWRAKEGLSGVPGKGAALNAVSEYCFKRLKEEGVGNNHLLDTPHPLVWIVQKARPVLVEAIARQYITGSMWRAYEEGKREFCGITLLDGLQKDEKLAGLLLTPTTKGTLRGIPGVSEKEDAPISLARIRQNYAAFQFYEAADVSICMFMLKEGFSVIEKDLDSKGSILVDTKMELGYVLNQDGMLEMIFIDEMVTPDSSRLWDKQLYQQGIIREDSKEGYRQYLLSTLDRNILLNPDRMSERKALAAATRVPVEEFMKVSATYRGIVEKIIGKSVPTVEKPREEILDVLNKYGLVE